MRGEREQSRRRGSEARRRGLPIGLLLCLCAALVLWLVAGEREEARTAPLAGRGPERPSPSATQPGALGEPASAEPTGAQPSARERATLPAPRPSPSTGEARSRAGARIQGRVLLADDGTPRAGLHVLAHEGEREPTLAWTAAALAARAPGIHATTDAEGAFAIDGLDPARVYTVLAGGAGLAGTQPRALVRPGPDVHTITVEQLYGATLVLRELGGARLRLSPSLEDSLRGRVSLQRPKAQRLGGEPGVALLAGVPLELLASESLDRRVLLFTAPASEGRLGPIYFRAALPGYRGLDLELEAQPVQHGLVEHSAELLPTASGFGELRIRLLGWSGDCPPYANTAGTAEVAAHLRLRTTRGETAIFELRDLAGSELSIEGIPYGAWRAELLPVARALFPRVGAGRESALVIGLTPAIYTLDLSRQAALTLELRARDGSLFRGAASLLVARDGAGDLRWRAQHFSRPPYRIDELEPGPYRVVLQRPFQAGTSTARPLPVELAGGRCTQLVLREE